MHTCTALLDLQLDLAGIQIIKKNNRCCGTVSSSSSAPICISTLLTYYQFVHPRPVSFILFQSSFNPFSFLFQSFFLPFSFLPFSSRCRKQSKPLCKIPYSVSYRATPHDFSSTFADGYPPSSMRLPFQGTIKMGVERNLDINRDHFADQFSAREKNNALPV